LKGLHAARPGGVLGILAAVTIYLAAHTTGLADSAPEPDGSLEEVIVTARKVPENVREIPLSIQVLTGERLDEANLTRMFDLQHHVPGLVLNTNGMFGAGFALRGVSDQGGLYLNGVYLGSSHLAIARQFDLERVEVLKGPQGTLYGRNANGGSINFITRTPQDGFGGELEGAYGSFDTARLRGHLDVPLGSAAARLAFIGSKGDGYIRNSVDERRFGEADYWGVRGSLALEPGEGWRIDLTAQRVYDDGASSELWLPNPAFLPDPDDIRLTTVTLADPYLRIENDFASLVAVYDLGHARFRSITGYARNETHDLDDCQGMPILRGCVRGSDPLTWRQWSQELQLASAGNERIDWLAGAYWFAGEERLHFFQWLPRVPTRPISDRYSTRDETAWALFGHATLHLGGGWGLSGGLRFSYEENEISDIGSGVVDNPELVVASGDWSQPSWRLDLEYAPRDGLFWYAGLSTGFRSGGVTTQRLPDGDFNRYQPEDLLAFETGVKAQWPGLGLTLDAAVFHYDFDNLQTLNRYFVDDVLYVEIDNAARAEVYGIDAAAALQVTERLDLSAAVVWLPKREYLDYTVGQGGDDLSGFELPRAPEWSATLSMTYCRPLAHYGELTGRLEYGYRSAFFYTLYNVGTEAQGAYGLLSLLLRYEPAQANWYVFAAGRNLTDEDYFHQVYIQAAPGYPDTWEVGLGLRF